MVTLAGSVSMALSVTAQAGAGPAIAGTVVDPEGKSMAGVEVLLTCGMAADGTVPALEAVKSDREGRFRPAIPPRDRLRRLGLFGSVWAYRPGSALALRSVRLAEGVDPAPLSIAMRAAAPRSVTARGIGGRPIAGAHVAARLVQTEQTGYLGVTIPDEWLDRLAVAGDAQGVAALPGLTRRVELRSVWVEVPGRVAHVARLRYADGPLDATLALGRPGRLEGAVKEASGEPVAGADVEVWMRCRLPAGSDRSLFLVPERVRTDGGPIRTVARGGFHVRDGATAGATYRVVVRRAGFAPALSDWITLRGDSGTLPPVTISRLRAVAGRVADRQGRPIAGARVFQAGEGLLRRPARTAGRGAAEAGRAG